MNHHKQYDIYKPNAYNAGCAFSFKILEKDKDGNPIKPSFLVQSIKQAKWNDQTKTGSFSENAKDPEKNIYFKLNENEIGGMLNAIENYTEFPLITLIMMIKLKFLLNHTQKKQVKKLFLSA